MRPPDIGIIGGEPFPIIHEIHRVARTVDDAVVFTEHQQAGQCESLFPGFVFRSVCPCLFQKIHVADSYPRMGRLQAREGLSILLQGFHISLEIEPCEDASVLRVTVVFGVREHSSYLRIGTEVIPFVGPPVSVSERIGGNINRAEFVARTGNIAYQDVRTVDPFYPYVRFMG